MKRKRYSDEQIAFARRQAENGTLVEEVCRKLGVSEATFYRWKKQFAGMGVVEIRRLKQLEEENAKLKRLVADQLADRVGDLALNVPQQRHRHAIGQRHIDIVGNEHRVAGRDIGDGEIQAIDIGPARFP
jgi:putative transposase